MSIQTRMTANFSITSGSGDVYWIEEFTEFNIMHMAHGVVEDPGKVWYQTDHGDGVNNNGDGTYTIPTLGVVGVDNQSGR